jgi:benzoate membrane transport protein
MKNVFQDFSLSALVAGFIATLISYAGPLVIIFQAAHSAQLSAAELSSWVWAISIGSGVLGVVLSLRFKVPVVIAWSAPGSALLVALLPDIAFAEAIGAYIVANLVILVVGVSGAFDRVVSKLPPAISAAMLAGRACSHQFPGGRA